MATDPEVEYGTVTGMEWENEGLFSITINWDRPGRVTTTRHFVGDNEFGGVQAEDLVGLRVIDDTHPLAAFVEPRLLTLVEQCSWVRNTAGL